MNTKYDFVDEPLKFYAKLRALNRKRNVIENDKVKLSLDRDLQQ